MFLLFLRQSFILLISQASTYVRNKWNKQDDEEEAGSDEEDDEEGELEAMDHDAPREMSKSRRKVLQLTSESVETWTKAALETQSLNALTNLIKAFRVAVHYGEPRLPCSFFAVSVIES